MTSNSKQPKAVDYPFEVNELLKFKKIFCPCSAALPLWDKYKDHIRSSGNTSFFCFYKTLSDIVITWCALLFALEPNFSTPSLFIVDDPQYWFQVINKLNPKIAQGIYFLSSLEKIGPDTPHPCYSVLVITNFTQYTSYIKHLQHELLILFVHIDEEEIHRPLSIYHSMILPCHETIDWEEELDAIDPLYIMPSKEERRSNHPVVIYQKAKTRENEENAEAELRRLSEMATTAPANLQMTNQLEFCKFIYWKNSSVPHEEVVHTEHKISLMIINIPDLTLYQKAINNYLFHYAPTDYITKLSAHYIRTKNNLRFGFPGFRSNLTTYFKTLILIILPNTCHIRWAYETLSSIRKSFSFTDHTRVTQICQTLPKTIDLIDPCDSLEAKILNWAHIAFSKTMACVFSSLTLNSSSRKVSSIISETREIHDTLLTEHYATKLFKLVRPTCRTRRLITIPPFESIPRITKFKSELVTAKKNHTANIILSLESNEETSVNIPHPNPLLSKTYLVNHILVMLSYLGLFISVPPRHSSLNLEDLFPLDRMIDPAQHKWRAHYVTFTLVAHCVLVPNTKFFACPDYTSGLIYAVTPAANHVIVGSYGDDVQKIISYILPNLLEGCKYFHFTYVPTDISALVITTATSLGYLHEIKPIKTNPIFSLTDYYREIYFFKKKCPIAFLPLASAFRPLYLDVPTLSEEAPLFSLE